MSQLIDVLSDAGLRTGEILPRAEIHRLGKPHRAVHLYLFNSNNELLLQRRAQTVDHAPGVLGISVTAHVDAGEYSFATVRREVEEELGLEASQLKFDFLFSFFQEAILHATYIDRQFNDVYVTRADIDPERIQFDRAEVAEVKFVSLESFHTMFSDSSSGYPEAYENEWRDLVYFLRNWFVH
jgi:isopentenyl-diphosphate delta-isomerase